MEVVDEVVEKWFVFDDRRLVVDEGVTRLFRENLLLIIIKVLPVIFDQTTVSPSASFIFLLLPSPSITFGEHFFHHNQPSVGKKCLKVKEGRRKVSMKARNQH